MDKQADISYRLAQFLAGLPPDTLGVVALFALEHPELVAVLLGVALFLLKYVVGLTVSAIVSWYLVKMLVLHAWPKLPPDLQQLLRGTVDRALLRTPGRNHPSAHESGAGRSEHRKRHPHW